MPLPKTLSTTATKTLETLIAGLKVGEARKIDTTNGAYQAVHVDRLSENRFAIAHYFESNGDLVADPDGEYLRLAPGHWLPVALQLSTGHYSRALELDGDKVVSYFPHTVRELASFATMWMRNIKNQQHLSRIK